MVESMKVLVGLSGRMRSGKDTVGEYLVAKYDFRRYAFADALKDLAYRIGWNGEKDQVGRRFLQQLGQGAREVIAPEIWIRALEARIANDRPERVVITDLRYENELKWILKRGGFTIRVDRDLDRNGDEHLHESEASIEDLLCHRTITNNGTIEELHHIVDRELMEFLFGVIRNQLE